MIQQDSETFVSKGLRLTKAQLDYIAEGSYGFVTRAGKSVYRDLKVMAQDKSSGNVIVREIYSGDYSYEKEFLLSPDGRPEKLKSSFKTNPLSKARPDFTNKGF